jgi:hypothetical protein
MPIRFRCAYCNQLLGISRRKAGTVVRCPTCAGQVVVPASDAEVADSNPGASNPLVFERNDFEDLLNTEGAVPLEKKESLATAAEAPAALPTATNPPPGAWGTHPEPPYDLERINPVAQLATAESVPQAGIFLSSRKATLVVVAVAVLLAAFFGAGLLFGLWLRPAAPESGHGRARPANNVYCDLGGTSLAQAASSVESGL